MVDNYQSSTPPHIQKKKKKLGQIYTTADNNPIYKTKKRRRFQMLSFSAPLFSSIGLVETLFQKTLFFLLHTHHRQPPATE